MKSWREIIEDIDLKRERVERRVREDVRRGGRNAERLSDGRHWGESTVTHHIRLANNGGCIIRVSKKRYKELPLHS